MTSCCLKEQYRLFLIKNMYLIIFSKKSISENTHTHTQSNNDSTTWCKILRKSLDIKKIPSQTRVTWRTDCLISLPKNLSHDFHSFKPHSVYSHFISIVFIEKITYMSSISGCLAPFSCHLWVRPIDFAIQTMLKRVYIKYVLLIAQIMYRCMYVHMQHKMPRMEYIKCE